MVNELQQLLYIIYPYMALTIFVLGLVLRYDRDPWGWTSKSSQILERRMLMWGSMMFHWAFIFVFIGHIMGLIIPISFYESLGINFANYHIIAFYGGAAAGVISVAGLLVLLARRLFNRKIKAISGIDDYFTLALLLFVMVSGLLNTLGFTILVGEYDYRSTIGVYIRSLLSFKLSASHSARASFLCRSAIYKACPYLQPTYTIPVEEQHSLQEYIKESVRWS